GYEGKQPAWCVDGARNAFAKYYPLDAAQGRRVALYEPKTKQVTLIPTCFETHHLNFGHTEDNILYFSGDFNTLGWINTRVWDETHDPQKSQGWCPSVLDTSGDGKIDPDRSHWNLVDGTLGLGGEGNARADAKDETTPYDPKKD